MKVACAPTVRFARPARLVAVPLYPFEAERCVGPQSDPDLRECCP
jgi:hypothetical protein